MAGNIAEIQVSGADVAEAVSKGLAQLGLDRSEVEIEILDSGSSGFLGIGGREATIKLTPLTKVEAVPEPVQDPGARAVVVEESDEVAAGVSEPADAVDEVSEDGRAEEEVAQEIVENLLDKLQFDASTSLKQTEPDDLTGERRWVIDIAGEDLGMLIGTRGETLNALQHVTRLMTGHALRQRPTFIIDVQGYRSRREQALARLAERMANKVAKRRRAMTLEPMPPNERRIIHLTLRDDQRVYTESFGEGRQRKVRIFPSD